MHRKIAALALFVAAAILASGQDDISAPIPENVKAHHKTLYTTYFDSNLKLKNIDQETLAGRDVEFSVRRFLTGMMDPVGVEESHQNPYPDTTLRGISCQADAVVIAVPKSAEATMTADQMGLFTDSRFFVESVLKNATTEQLEDSSIIVTRPGGETTVHGRSVRVTVSGFPQFAMGHRYLLFLGHLSATHTFEAFDIGSFELTNGAVAPFHTGLSAILSLKSEGAFLAEVRAAIAAPCEHQTFPPLGKHTGGTATRFFPSLLWRPRIENSAPRAFASNSPC